MSSLSILTAHDSQHALQPFLEGIVQRDPSLLSAGLRRDGRLLVCSDEHESSWSLPEDSPSTAECMFVPLMNENTDWGRLEICFAPIEAMEVFPFVRANFVGLALFVSSISFLAFNFLLSGMLKQLDPSVRGSQTCARGSR